MSDRSERLKLAMRIRGVENATELARLTGLNVVTVRSNVNGARGFSAESAEIYARVLKIDVAWLLLGKGSGPKGPLQELSQEFVNKRPGKVRMQADDAAEPNTSPAPNAPGLTPAYLLPRDLPVLGTAECGPNGVFEMNGGEPINYERRPVILAGNRKAFAVYAHGDSMEPLFFSGDTVYIDPGRPPTVGRAVLVEFHPIGDENPRGMLKVLLKMNSEFIELRQLNPENSENPFRFRRKEVKAIFRVLTNQELAGG